jgi:16S rRNA (cytosine967-C5)-methyltransferase
MNIRHEAYDIIVKVLKHREYSDNLLQHKANKLRHQDNEQIAFLYQIVKGTIKFQAHLDYICRQYTDKEKFVRTDLKTKVLLYIGLYQLKFMQSVPDHAAVHETVELAKTLYGEPVANFINSVLRSYQRQPEITYPEDQAERIAFEHSYPVLLIRDWLKLWGEEHTEMLAMFYNEPAKLHLRVNTAATETHKLIKYFAKRNIHCITTEASSNLLICDNALAALEDVSFSEGYFSVQDTSAALIVELLDPQPGESVLDLFAAPGGKCTYIAEKMKNAGEVIAVDKSPGKMKLLKQAMERLQLDNIQLIVQDAFSYGPVAPAFQRVLVDAPCSGWGVLGRKADLRWQHHQNVADLVKLQEKALNYGASFVKPGGCLVYSTCTLNPEENERRIDQFLKKNDRFKLTDAGSYIPPKYTSNGFMASVPYIHFMDGAFAARLQRIK